MNTRQDSNMIDHTGAMYAKIETKLSCLIGSDEVYDKN